MSQNSLHAIEAVFFDLDGTLVDTAPDFVCVVNQLRREHSLEPMLPEQVNPYVSIGSGGLITGCLGMEVTHPSFEKARERLLKLYGESGYHGATLFPNADLFLNTLDQKKIPWGIITNKPKRFAIPIIKKLNLHLRSICLLCPEHVKDKKPAPESLILAAKYAKKPASASFYLGDHLRDIQAGFAAGMKTGSVAFGYIPPGENPLEWSADFHFEDFNHIHTAFFGDPRK